MKAYWWSSQAGSLVTFLMVFMSLQTKWMNKLMFMSCVVCGWWQWKVIQLSLQYPLEMLWEERLTFHLKVSNESLLICFMNINLFIDISNASEKSKTFQHVIKQPFVGPPAVARRTLRGCGPPVKELLLHISQFKILWVFLLWLANLATSLTVWVQAREAWLVPQTDGWFYTQTI